MVKIGKMKRLNKIITKSLLIPLTAGMLAGCKPIMKVKKDFCMGYGELKGQIGYAVEIGKYDVYDKDKEVCYRKVGEREWVREEGVWKKHTDEPDSNLGWVTESYEKVSDKEIPIYVQDLYKLWMDNDPGENSAFAKFVITGYTPLDGKLFYGIKQPSKRELKHLNKQANEWIEKARRYFN